MRLRTHNIFILFCLSLNLKVYFYHTISILILFIFILLNKIVFNLHTFSFHLLSSLNFESN